VLEKLLNDSDTNWAEDDLPTYVITKEEKIFFYENPKPVTEELMGRRTDSSVSKILASHPKFGHESYIRAPVH